MMASASPLRLIAVAGSGERVISLLGHEPLKEIDIVDPNREALFLTELKLTALRLFSASDYLFFIGFYAKSERFKDREEMLPMVLAALSRDCASYWQAHRGPVLCGSLLVCGHFESFLMRVHAVIRILLGAKMNTVLNTPIAQWGGYERGVWKLLRRTFNYKMAYRLMGNADPAFIHKGADPSIIGQALQELFLRNEQGDAFFVHLLFKGHLRQMRKAALPDSLSEGFLSCVKETLDRDRASIAFHQTDLRTYLRQQQEIARTFISASDLLSFEPPEYIDDLIDLLISRKATGSNQLVWRSFLKHRGWNYGGSAQAPVLFEDISRHERTLMYQVYSATTGERI